MTQIKTYSPSDLVPKPMIEGLILVAIPDPDSSFEFPVAFLSVPEMKEGSFLSPAYHTGRYAWENEEGSLAVGDTLPNGFYIITP